MSLDGSDKDEMVESVLAVSRRELAGAAARVPGFENYHGAALGSLARSDKRVYDLLVREYERMLNSLQLIAAENVCSQAVLAALGSAVQNKTTEGTFIVTCQRENPVDGIQQLAEILQQCKLSTGDGPFITIDISSFTKIYLLELLHYLVVELSLPMPRLLHTTQKYSPSRLTRGIEQITTIPHYFGKPDMNKETLLVLFLGFEPDRALSIWKQYNPGKTIALITNPPRDGSPEYLEYARRNNADLLSRPNVELRDVPADDPPGIRTVLESVFEETKDGYNMVVGPFGTKPHVVGIFLFCREHPGVKVIYSYPQSYTRSYLQRKPGITMQIPAFL